MSGARRVLWEIFFLLIFAAAIYGLWWWTQRDLGAKLAGQSEVHAAELAGLRADCEVWADNMTGSEAQAAFRSFAAGIHPAVLAGRTDDLNRAKSEVLRLPEVASVHVLAPDGTVIVSSDEKYTTSGAADERAAWVLEAKELTTRAGEFPGMTEIAAPILGSSGAKAILWMRYKSRNLKEETRPGSMKP